MTHRYEVDSWDKDWQEVEGPETPQVTETSEGSATSETSELARSQ